VAITLPQGAKSSLPLPDQTPGRVPGWGRLGSRLTLSGRPATFPLTGRVPPLSPSSPGGSPGGWGEEAIERPIQPRDLVVSFGQGDAEDVAQGVAVGDVDCAEGGPGIDQLRRRHPEPFLAEEVGEPAEGATHDNPSIRRA